MVLIIQLLTFVLYFGCCKSHMDNEWEWRQLCFCYSLSHLLGLNPNCTELGERLVFIGSVKQGASKTFHNIIIKVKCQLLFDNISKGLWISSMKQCSTTLVCLSLCKKHFMLLFKVFKNRQLKCSFLSTGSPSSPCYGISAALLGDTSETALVAVRAVKLFKKSSS